MARVWLTGNVALLKGTLKIHLGFIYEPSACNFIHCLFLPTHPLSLSLCPFLLPCLYLVLSLALPWLSWLKKMLFMRRRRWTLWKIKLFDCCSNYYSWLHLFALFLARNFIYNAGATCQTKRRPDCAACYLLLAASSLQLATYSRSSQSTVAVSRLGLSFFHVVIHVELRLLLVRASSVQLSSSCVLCSSSFQQPLQLLLKFPHSPSTACCISSSC